MYISIGVVRALVAALESQGFRTERVLRAGELARSDLRSAGRGVRFRDLDRMLTQALQLTADPGLGLRVGAEAPETMLNVLGLLLVTSPTVRDAHQQLTRYSDLVVSGTQWRLQDDGELAQLGFASRFDANDATPRFLADCALAVVARIASRFVPADALREVRFQHAEPSYAARYASIFRVPVKFSCKENALVFQSAYLDRLQPHADPMLCASLGALADGAQARAKGDGSFADRIRVALRYQTDLSKVDTEALASSCGVSRRALRRRLSGEGQSLTELLDEVRCERAVKELRRLDCKIKQVAEDLGYSETSAFHRAFKRWTGRTPSDYRTDLRRSLFSSDGMYALGPQA